MFRITALILFLMIIVSVSSYAELTYQGAYDSNLTMSEYFEKAYPNPQKSIIYVFFNDVNMNCQDCPQTIELIEQVYNRYYQNQYDFYVIDYGNDDEYNFMQAYDLNQPLEVVLVRVDDGAVFGYKKLDNLNYQISDPVSFRDNLVYQINAFLGD